MYVLRKHVTASGGIEEGVQVVENEWSNELLKPYCNILRKNIA